MNNENELPPRMQLQDCHGAKQAIKFAWPKQTYGRASQLVRTAICASGAIRWRTRTLYPRAQANRKSGQRLAMPESGLAKFDRNDCDAPMVVNCCGGG